MFLRPFIRSPSSLVNRPLVTSGFPKSHCGFCGGLFIDEAFPRTCHCCKKQTFDNPIPVCVGVIRASDPKGNSGLLVVRRAIPPAVGGLCFPGGFMEVGETINQCVAREVREETGLDLDPALFITKSIALSSPIRNRLLIFNEYVGDLRRSDLDAFVPNAEVSELLIAPSGTELCFSLHQEVFDNILTLHE